MTKSMSTLYKHALAACSLLGIAVAVACSSSTPTGLNCGDGAQECNGTCTVVARDPQNCGACGKSCMAGELCSQGSCASACGGGTTKCGSECVDTKSDPRNCGSCGKGCQANEVCMAGACATSCGASTMKCGMSCVNTMTDPTNCGGCGTMCTNGQSCVGGKCALACAQPTSLCDASMLDGGAQDGGPMGQYCANLQEDNNNCGACGVQCSGTTPLCKGGKCVFSSCGVKQCDQGSDVANQNLTWTVCQADCNTAWVSMLSANGGMYHAEWICKQLGYTKIGQISGTYNHVCTTTNQQGTSCSMPGTKMFAGTGACGSDTYGAILCNTVTWECLK